MILLAAVREVQAWADSPVASSRFDRQAVEMPRYAQIESEFAQKIDRLVEARVSGKITEQEMVQRFRSQLRQAETDAFVAGRRAGGNSSNEITDAEMRMLAGRHSRNMRYFSKFARDISAGRGRMPYSQRGRMYAESLWSIYSRGESVRWGDEQSGVYDWLLDVDAEHCRTCIQRAAMSRQRNGFTFDELIEIGFPGEGTECATRCRCSVVFRKRKQIEPDKLPSSPAPSAEVGVEQLAKLLGGKELPVRIPSAGIPYTAITKSVVESSIRSAPESVREKLGRYMPLVPKTLVQPADVITHGSSMRTYIGYGIEVAVARDAYGLWRVAAIELVNKARDHAA